MEEYKTVRYAPVFGGRLFNQWYSLVESSHPHGNLNSRNLPPLWRQPQKVVFVGTPHLANKVLSALHLYHRVHGIGL